MNRITTDIRGSRTGGEQRSTSTGPIRVHTCTTGRPSHPEPRTIDLNAAQRQMVVEGYMPNRLRMYWSKQLLYWTPDPETAFDVAVGFNDRYFIDGRDPNGYGGIAWAIGGRHDRPFPPRKPVLGLIRPMGIRAMQKHFDVDTYVTAIESRYGPT